MIESFTDWLLGQAPVVVVMGAAIIYQSRELAKSNKRKDQMIKEFTELGVLWEKRADSETLKDDFQYKGIEEKLNRIISILEGHAVK